MNLKAASAASEVSTARGLYPAALEEIDMSQHSLPNDDQAASGRGCALGQLKKLAGCGATADRRVWHLDTALRETSELLFLSVEQ